MSTTTLKLPYKRFIAQVSTGAPRSKSTYLALMEENLEALKACPWREAADVPASLTGHDFTAPTQFSDAYDAFKLTGNYDQTARTEIAYAGMAAYRFKMPASAVSGSVAVASVSLPISRDRFEKSGVHLAVALSDSATPTSEWDVVRGSGDLAASSQLAQTAANLMAGSADAGTVEIDLSGVSAGNPSAYLWVYVTLEDYTDHWEMYNAKEKRLYAIEGSAMLTGGSVQAAFDGEVAADSGADGAYSVCCGSALPEAGEGPAGVKVDVQFTGDTLPEDGAVSTAALEYKAGVPVGKSAAGLRMAYAALYAGHAAAVQPAAHAMRPGAKFLVEAAERYVEATGAGVGLWRVAASALVVPFAAPAKFSPRAVRFAWGACAASVTEGLRWRVWLKPGTASLNMPNLADAGFWTPGSTAADGFALAGEFAASAAAGTAEVPIALSAPLATVAVTGFLPLDGVNPSDGMPTSFGCAEEFRPAVYLLP